MRKTYHFQEINNLRGVKVCVKIRGTDIRQLHVPTGDTIVSEECNKSVNCNMCVIEVLNDL
jgi:hypothetical protein